MIGQTVNFMLGRKQQKITISICLDSGGGSGGLTICAVRNKYIDTPHVLARTFYPVNMRSKRRKQLVYWVFNFYKSKYTYISHA